MTASSGTSQIAEVEAAVRSVLATKGRSDRTDVFGGRLFALRHAEALTPATLAIGIAPGTVVTPLARDLLKTRGVALRQVSRRELARVKNPGEWAFAIEPEVESGAISAL